MEQDTQLYEVEVDPDVNPTQEEFFAYAAFLGIDVEKEPHLLDLAEEGIYA